MTLYTLAWVIDIEADTPEEAAVLAREIQLDPHNVARHFYWREWEADGIDLFLESFADVDLRDFEE